MIYGIEFINYRFVTTRILYRLYRVVRANSCYHMNLVLIMLISICKSDFYNIDIEI